MAANAEATVTLSLVDRLTAPIKRISARIAAMSRRLGIDRITGAVGRLGGSLRGLGDGLARSTGRLSGFLGLLGAGAGGAVFGAFRLAQGAAEIGDEVAKTARQLGIGAEALQEYRYAAKMSGVEQASLDKGMLRFGVNVSDAVKGNKALAKEFAAMGIRLKDSRGQLRSMDDVFTDTVEAISKMPDAMTRSRAAMKLFGKGGIELTRLFEIGADGMAVLREEARETGHVMSDRASKFSEVFGDNVERLQKRLEGLKLFIGVQLMPVMNELVVGLAEWFDANRALVVSTLQDWVKSLTGFIRALIDPTSEIRVAFSAFGETLSSIVGFIKPLTDRIGALNAGLILVAAWIFGPMLAALVTLGTAVVNLGIVIMSTPIGWILGGIALMAAAVYVLYQRWDEFAAYWGGLWGRIKEAFNQGFVIGIITLLKEFNPVTHIARGINAMIEYFTGIDLMSEGSRLIHSLTAGISAGAADLGAFISEAVASAWASYEAWWNGFSASVYAAGGAIVQSLWDGLESKWEGVVAWLRGAVADLIGWLPESIQKKIGFNVDSGVTGANDNAPGEVGRKVGELGGDLLKSVPQGASEERALAASNDNRVPTSGDNSVKTVTVAANSVQAQSIQIAEPIIAHQPQTINAPTTVHLTVNAPPGLDAKAVAVLTRREIEAAGRRQAAAIESRLSD
jgi:hypothetical protein